MLSDLREGAGRPPFNYNDSIFYIFLNNTLKRKKTRFGKQQTWWLLIVITDTCPHVSFKSQYSLEVRAQLQKVKSKHYLVESARGSKIQSFWKNKTLFFKPKKSASGSRRNKSYYEPTTEGYKRVTIFVLLVVPLDRIVNTRWNLNKQESSSKKSVQIPSAV